MKTFLFVVALFGSALSAQSVAGGFTVETVANPVAMGRAMAFAPDGRLFYTENATGRIMVIDNAIGSPGVPGEFATVSGFVPPSGNDLGLHGIALHPQFPADPGVSANRYVYVVHATGTAGAPQLIVKRFTENIANLGQAAPGSETPNISGIDMGSAGFNFGGRVAFGPDGLLYVSVGDGGSAVSLGGTFAQDVNDRRGKVLRFTPDGSIPLNNPISANPMYARGFRNPRGLAFHPNTFDGFVTDSGNPLASGADELNVLQGAGNYGWDGNGRSGTQNLAAFVDPAWVLSDTFEPSGVAFAPLQEPAGTFPETGYRSGVAYVASEAPSGAILRVVLTGGAERHGVAAWPFAGGFSSAVRDIGFGPDGNLYVLSDGLLQRIRYTGNSSPNNPVANAGPDQTVDAGKLVTLNGGSSFDADISDVLRFTWRQVGGATLIPISNPTASIATFTAPAVSFTDNFTFELIVEDGNGGVSSDRVIITVNPTGGVRRSPMDVRGEGGCSSSSRSSRSWALLLIASALSLLRSRRATRDSRAP